MKSQRPKRRGIHKRERLYRVLDLAKYGGDPTKVVARSNWEYRVFKFLDGNPNVVKWTSEETIVSYKCRTDNKLHRYFVDLKVTMKNGQTYLIEIKPLKYTLPPAPTERRDVYLRECLKYAKNKSKWEAATKYCERRGWIFTIWHEGILEKFGIRGIVPGKKLKIKKPGVPART